MWAQVIPPLYQTQLQRCTRVSHLYNIPTIDCRPRKITDVLVKNKLYLLRRRHIGSINAKFDFVRVDL